MFSAPVLCDIVRLALVPIIAIFPPRLVQSDIINHVLGIRIQLLLLSGLDLLLENLLPCIKSGLIYFALFAIGLVLIIKINSDLNKLFFLVVILTIDAI